MDGQPAVQRSALLQRSSDPPPLGGHSETLQRQVNLWPAHKVPSTSIAGNTQICFPNSAKEDVAVLGVHDLGKKSSQTILVDEVFSPMHGAGFPPQADLSLLRLSVSARYGKNLRRWREPATTLIKFPVKPNEKRPVQRLFSWLTLQPLLQFCENVPWFCLEVQKCLRYVSLRKTRNWMKAGPVSQRDGEELKQQVREQENA